MQPFLKADTSNFRDIPVKARIKFIQDQSAILGKGKKLTWKQAKESLEYIMRGDRYINDIYDVQH